MYKKILKRDFKLYITGFVMKFGTRCHFIILPFHFFFFQFFNSNIYFYVYANNFLMFCLYFAYVSLCFSQLVFLLSYFSIYNKSNNYNIVGVVIKKKKITKFFENLIRCFKKIFYIYR